MSLITVQFDTIVYWAGGAGIAGVELSKTDEFLGSPETAVIHEVIEGTGESNILTYVVTWPTEPVVGDIITFAYTAADGFYQDSGAVLMADKTLDIRNCGSPLPPIVILPIGTLEIYVGVPFSLDVTTGFDEGTGVLTGYTVGALPSGLVFDGQFITGTPDTIASTPSSVTCTTDVLPAAVDPVTWDIIAIPVAPTVVTPILDQSEAWGTVIHFDVTTGFDTGTGTPVFTVDNAPPGLLFDGTFLDGTLNTVGTYPTVTVTCATGVLPDAVDVFSFEVTAVAPSVVTPIVDQVNTIGDPINMDMTTGFDTGSGTPVVFTMLDIPSGLAFDGQFLTGTLDTVATYNPSVTCSTGVLPDAVDTLVWEVQSAGGGAVTYEEVILADSPILYYRLDELSGNPVDEIAAVVMTEQAAGLDHAQPSLLKSDASNFSAASASGTGYCSTASAAAWEITGSGFSCELIMMPDTSLSSNQVIIGKRLESGNYNGWQLRVGATVTGRLEFLVRVFGGNQLKVYGSTTLQKGVPYHVVLTYDGSQNASGVNIYVDGVSESLTVVDNALTTHPTSTQSLSMFAAAGGLNPFDGTLDEVSLYDYELTPAKVLTHYTAYLPPPSYSEVILADTPVAYWRMDETSGVVAVDEIDSPAQDGVYNNAPVLGFAPLINEGSSVSFNGSNEWMRAAGVNATPDASDFSWECWAKFTDSEWRIMDSRGTGTYGTVNGLQFSETSGGTYLNTGVDDGAGNTARLGSISVGDDDDDNPHHFVLTWETGTGTLSLYVDGVLKGSDTNAALIGMTFTRAQPFTVAASANTSGTQLFNGEVDEVAIYHYKLSPAQIVNHFNVGKGVTAYEAAVLSSWPSRFYMLDEMSGDIVSVAERKATSLPPTGTPGYGIGSLVENNPAGTAIQFDGASYFRGTNFVFQDDVTVAFIMNLAAPPAAYTIIVDQYDGGGSTGGIIMALATDGRLEFDCKTIGSGTWRVNKSAYSVCDGITHHCVATIENNNLLLYVDGVRQPFNTNSNPTGSCYYNTPLAIGAYFYGTAQYHYAGKLDCVALWDRALTKTEINRLYVAAKVVTEDTYANEILADTPTVFYKFDESSGAVITDYSGNAYSGTYVGSPVLAQQPIVQDDGFSMIVNGSSQYARVDTTAIQPGTGDFSVEISFNTGAAGIRQTLLDCRHPSIEAGFLIGIDITNGLFMYMADGTPGVSFVTTRSFNDNHDHILTVVFDRSGYAYAYVDGRLALEGYILSEPASISTGNSIFIGNVGVTSSWTYFKGKIDNFAYFPSVLTPERVVAHARAAGLYDEGEAALSNPLLYTKFDNSDGFSVCTNNDGVIDLQGTYTGGIQAVLGLSSDNGQAMDVDASHYLGLSSPGIKGKRNAFTVQVALKPSQISLLMSICGYGDQGQAGYAGWNIRAASVTGGLHINTYNGSWTTTYFGGELAVDESHLWTFTVDYDRNLLRLHKDGQHVQDTTLGTTIPPTGTWYSQPVYVGVSDINFLQYPFYGVIDDFMFYDHALPDDEIQRIAQDRGFYPTVGPVFDYYEVIEALGPNQWFKMQAGELATNSAIGAPDATNTDVTETTGLIDGAGSFNGSTSHLVVPADPTHADLIIPGGHIAAECLIYLNNVTSTLDMIATKGNDTATNLGWHFRIDTNNRAHIILFTAGNWLRYTSTAAIPRQQWIHLAFSAYCGADTSQEKLWVNGAPVAVTHESNWSGTPSSDASYPLIIGERYVDGTAPGDYPMNAILDNISIYNKPLSDVEVLRLATAAGLA